MKSQSWIPVKKQILKPHLTLDEIAKCYRCCKDGHVKARWHAIWLKAQGKKTTEIAELLGFKPDWIRKLINRWNDKGPQAIPDQREKNGREPLLSLQQQAQLQQDLMGPAPDGGLWNRRKVAKWISEKIGRSVPQNSGWIYLRALGFTSQTLRPRHRSADKKQQEEFKKKTPSNMLRHQASSS